MTKYQLTIVGTRQVINLSTDNIKRLNLKYCPKQRSLFLNIKHLNESECRYCLASWEEDVVMRDIIAVLRDYAKQFIAHSNHNMTIIDLVDSIQNVRILKEEEEKVKEKVVMLWTADDRFEIYVKPNTTLADLKRQVLECLWWQDPEKGRSIWNMSTLKVQRRRKIITLQSDQDVKKLEEDDILDIYLMKMKETKIQDKASGSPNIKYDNDVAPKMDKDIADHEKDKLSKDKSIIYMKEDYEESSKLSCTICGKLAIRRCTLDTDDDCIYFCQSHYSEIKDTIPHKETVYWTKI